MAIFKDGIDVTAQVHAIVAEKAEKQRAQTNNYQETKIHLMKARLSLMEIRPWMEDCIGEAMQKIREAEKILE